MFFFASYITKENFLSALNYYLQDIWIIPWPLVRMHTTTFICTSASATQELWKFTGKYETNKCKCYL